MHRLGRLLPPLGPWKRASGHPFRLDMVVWLWLRPQCENDVVEPEAYWLDSMAYIFDSMDDRYYPNSLTGRP